MTSVGANIEEASAAQSKKDFIAKMNIASKEARETNYWIRLLKESQFFNIDFVSSEKQSLELVKFSTAIVKSAQQKL